MTKRQAVGRASLAGCAAVALAAVLARRRPTAGAAVAAAAAAAAWGAFRPSSPLFGPTLRSGPRGRPRAALTFDDGPGPSTPDVLDALAGEGVRATFFVLGRQAERHPDLVRRIAAEGHEIGNHGYDHGILVFRGDAHVADQLSRTESAVHRAAGEGTMRPLFRAPHGYRGPATARAAGRRGYRVASWTRGVFDSAEPGADVIAERATRALVPGAVILLHDADGWAPERVRGQTAAAIPSICRAARERGIELVPLGELVDS
jgi:peptidoglycan/xylan/chitin deacetylase (PgdA/CDA1 family)